MDNPLQEQLLAGDGEPSSGVTTATAGGNSTFINMPPSSTPPPTNMTPSFAPNASSIPPPPVPHPTAMATLDSNSNNDTPNSMGNLINESYNSLSQLQWALLGLTVFYNVTTRLLVELDLMQHHAHFSLGGNYHFVGLLADLMRMVACGGIEAFSVHRRTAASETTQQQQQAPQDAATTVAEYLLDLESSLRTNLLQNWKDALKPAIPVALAQVQGYFSARAVEHLPITLAEFTFHGSLLGIALGSTMFLDYSYTRQQWICLSGLVLGAIIMSTHKSIFIEGNDANNQFEKVMIGFGGLIGSIAAASLLVISFERMLKQDLALQRADPPSASLWMRCIQYSLFSGLYNFVMGGYNGGELARSGWTWFFTPMAAAGTVITIGVIKYVTALHDRIAIELTFVVTMLMNWWLFRFEMTATWMLYVGALFMLTSAYFFGCELPPALRNRYQRIAMPSPGAEDETGGVSLGMSTMTMSGAPEPMI